ncbi:MAG: CAF17-like 4Fe-4S cluster assembly/insertion protein YgfZ [Lysobacter sp.]
MAFALTDHHLVSLTGRDAVAFAQAQFMNDVDAIASGRWQWNGWLTPKGRVIALFALLRIDDETVWLLLPDADPASMVAALQRFVFRSKVTIAILADRKVSAAFAAPDDACGAQIGTSEAGVVELDMGAEGGPRRLRIGVDAAGDNALLARWTAFDLQHGLPRLPAAQVEHWTPQQLSLERLGAFSVKKGCYPGQEIVARTHFLGKAKRGLALLEADAPLLVGAEVRDGDTLMGTVIAAASVAGRHLGLAVVPKERTSVVSDAGGIAVRELPLGNGLAR